MARHRLQRLDSPSRTVSLVIHIAGISSFLASFQFLSQLDIPVAVGYGGHFQFFTNIGLLLAFFTFCFGFLADVTLHPKLFAAKNALSVCATPIEVLISTLYWGISAIDKSLLFPPEFQLHWLPDVGFHLVPAVMLTLDLLLLSPPWTIRVYSTMMMTFVIALLYWAWVEYCFSKNGWYPYPMFELLDTPQRVALFTFSAGLATASTSVLKWVYGRVNGYEKLEKEATQPFKKVN